MRHHGESVAAYRRVVVTSPSCTVASTGWIPLCQRMHEQVWSLCWIGIAGIRIHGFVSQLKADAPTVHHFLSISHTIIRIVIRWFRTSRKSTSVLYVIAGNVGAPQSCSWWKMRADATKVESALRQGLYRKVKTGFGTGGWQLAALTLNNKKAARQTNRPGWWYSDSWWYCQNRFVSEHLWSWSVLTLRDILKVL